MITSLSFCACLPPFPSARGGFFRGHLGPSFGILLLGMRLGAPAEAQKQLKSIQPWIRQPTVTAPLEVGLEAPFPALGRMQIEALHTWIYREGISRAHIFPSRLKSTWWTLPPMGDLIKRSANAYTHTHTHTHTFLVRGMYTLQKRGNRISLALGQGHIHPYSS